MSVDPGLTAFAVTPVPRSSAASARTKPVTPAFAAQYAASIGSPRVAAAEATARNRPLRGAGRRSSAGTCRPGEVQHAAEVDVEHRRLLVGRELPGRHAAGDNPGRGDRPRRARPSAPRRRDHRAPARRVTDVGHVARRTSAPRRPDDLVELGPAAASAVRESPGRRRPRSTATTRQPSAASAATVAAPMPRAAPVTSATRPAGLVAATALTGSAVIGAAGSAEPVRRPSRPGRRARPRAVEQRRALGGGRAGRVAEHAVRADRARRRALEEPACSSASGRFAGLGRDPVRTARGVERQHQRGLGPAGVGVAAPVAASTRSTSRRTRRASRCAARATASALPAVRGHEQDAGEASVAERPSSTSTQLERVLADRQRAGKVLVLAAGPVGQRRRGHARPVRGREPLAERGREIACRWTAAGAGRAARSSRPGPPGPARPGRSPVRPRRRVDPRPRSSPPNRRSAPVSRRSPPVTARRRRLSRPAERRPKPAG